MAIVRVDYPNSQPEGFAPAVAACINRVMQNVLGVPPAENYVVCQAHAPGAILHAPGDCPPERLAQIVFIQITLNLGRSAELKARFFATRTAALTETGLLLPQNVYINLVEVARENWSFGHSAT